MKDYGSIDFTQFLEKLVPNYELTSMGKLVSEFYFHNILPLDIKPFIAFHLDPEGMVPIGAPTYLHTYYALMYRRFFATVTINPRSVHGYHRMQLWYRCEQIKTNLWLAAAQSNECYFFDTDAIQASIFRATRLREWYLSPDETKKSVIW
jgi:hypothetical protein